jgi:hypothetical protein
MATIAVNVAEVQERIGFSFIWAEFVVEVPRGLFHITRKARKD